MKEYDLIKECQSGSETAYRCLVKQYYQDAYAMAYYWIRNREVALDISQEAFIRIFRNIKKYDLKRSFKAWMYTIVKNLCMNYFKRHQKKRILFSDYFFKREENIQTMEGFQSNPEGNEQAQLLWWGIKQLKDSEREIVLLKDMEDFSYKEISDILNIPLGTVMSRLYNARKKLAQIVKGEQNVE